MVTTPENLSYPVGRLRSEDRLSPERRAILIDEIADLPNRLGEVLATLSAEVLDTAYRPGGWSARQVIHHLADSHLNALVRLKLALTEEVPTIKPYREDLWADLPDVATVAPEVSVRLLEALHARWVAILRALSEEAFSRRILHPEHGRTQSIDEMISSYAWHGRHHLAHIELARRTAAAKGG